MKTSKNKEDRGERSRSQRPNSKGAVKTQPRNHFEKLVPSEWIKLGHLEDLALKCGKGGVDAESLYVALTMYTVRSPEEEFNFILDTVSEESTTHEAMLGKLRDHNMDRQRQLARFDRCVIKVANELVRQIDGHRKSRKGNAAGAKKLEPPLIRYLTAALVARYADLGAPFPSALMELVIKSLDADLLRYGPTKPDSALYRIAVAKVEHPEWGEKKIADEVGCKRQYVNTVLKNADVESKQTKIRLSDLIRQLTEEKEFKEHLRGALFLGKVPPNVTAKREKISPTIFGRLAEKRKSAMIKSRKSP